MSNIDKYIKQFRAFAKELLADKEKAARFLRDAGIHDENGNLTEQYRNT